MTKAPDLLPGADDEASATPERSLLRTLLLWGVPLLAVGAAFYLYGSAGRFVSTDDAYLQQDRVDVAAQVAGNVVEVLVAENQRVELGQPLIQLDQALLKLALAGAESRLAAARTEVLSLKAAWREKRGTVAVARTAAEFSARELARQTELADRKLVAAATLEGAQRAAALADGTTSVLQLQLDQAAARLEGRPESPVDDYAAVRAALTDLERARVELAKSLIRAPQPGIVSHLPKVGSRVDIGRAACAIVVDQELWIEANFKETDLEWVRVGQPVRIEVDTFPEHRWEGRVASISQATGAAFSVLPPQNASGNWVKVVQRIPVRIAITRRPDDPPLRNGMSALVEIDTGPHSRFDRWFRQRG